MNVLELSEQEIGRRQSLQELRAMGIDPYPAAEFPTNAFSTDIKENFKDDEEREVVIAGRMMSRRVMGKASFAELQDSKGRIQVYITRDDICPGENKDLYNNVFKRLLDIGDFIGVKGKVFRTQTGEISVHASELTLLSKSLKPLPIVKYKDGVAYDKFDDPELRYRQRYVDLVVNEGVKDTFLQRATVIRTLRKVLDDAGYTEVETPTLQMIAGGASARPFITHFNALDQDMYMRIATELYLKRLIVGGFEGVYEIGKPSVSPSTGNPNARSMVTSYPSRRLIVVCRFLKRFRKRRASTAMARPKKRFVPSACQRVWMSTKPWEKENLSTNSSVSSARVPLSSRLSSPTIP